MEWHSVFASRMGRMKASEIRELLKLLDQPEVISFAGGIPDPALFPAEAFRAAFEKIFATGASAALQYSVSEGHRPLRDWIAGEMGRIGVPCTRENILITSGSQQALDYLGKLLLSPGDTALLGWPTYLGALGAFNAYEPRYDQLTPGGNRGAEAYRQAAEAAGSTVKFAYVSADFANPTGETLSLRERESLLDLAEALDIPLLEDAAYQALRYRGEAIPPILSLDVARSGSIEAARTIYCGSFSKTLSPGLRVGWVCAPQAVIARLVLMKQAADLHSATLNQMAVAEVAQTIYAEHTEMLRDTYATRCAAMLAALTAHMPEGVTWSDPEGGMFVWLTLPRGMDAAELLKQALEQERIAFVPGGAFFADGSGRNTLRLSFSRATPEKIETGMQRLGKVLRAALVAA
ncbi:PLP-dependent aminotransferase family protein [Pseudoruegeria sp. SHC-113]|uniref:aminotransferase-like domain-containing protein n=1 Tax=Pseudoruegeria sp. SHC-113 TaxID=2855439 RepID=UPI0021BA5B95|nr:PLP-dependent aminotransferase family protein [Pseudoruegeria sp. SHC-113]MCT8159119.1 PLP-dependent aminotransferase family protein [Pseudoruegeria sp. SHC-113]